MVTSGHSTVVMVYLTPYSLPPPGHSLASPLAGCLHHTGLSQYHQLHSDGLLLPSDPWEQALQTADRELHSCLRELVGERGFSMTTQQF